MQETEISPFDDQIEIEQELPVQGSDDDMPMQPKHMMKVGNFSIANIVGKRVTRNYLGQVLEIDEEEDQYHIQFFKAATSTKTTFGKIDDSWLR